MASILSQLNPLEKRVLRQLGGGTAAIEYAADAARHGANGGFPGFIYYTETVAFFQRNRKAILANLKALAEDIGETPSQLLKGFRVLKDVADPMLTLTDKNDDDYTTVANALAWFALEETGQHILRIKGE
jgi:hypothetical protein